MTVRRFSRTFPLLAALLLGAACAVLVACGGSGGNAGLIPDNQAETMIDQLDTIQSSVSRGRCSGVDTQVAELQTQINGLSRRVDASLKSRLQEGVNNLADIAPSECFDRREDKQATTETATTETTTTETTPTETTPETTPTETVPTTPETTPTVPPVTTPTVPPETTPVDPGGGTPVDPGDTGGGVGGATPDTGTP